MIIISVFLFVSFIVICFYIKRRKDAMLPSYFDKFQKIREKQGDAAADLAFKKDVLRENGYMFSIKTHGNIREYIALYADEIYLKIYVENSIWLNQSLMYENVSFERYKVFIDAIFNRGELKGYLDEEKLFALASPEKIAYYKEVQKRYLHE
ncbi:MAG: hypothetical protein ACK5N8_08580 [Alphaproteobacteria bacterium]